MPNTSTSAGEDMHNTSISAVEDMPNTSTSAQEDNLQNKLFLFFPIIRKKHKSEQLRQDWLSTIHVV